MWEVIYVLFYNWDSPLDFVPVLYDLIELIIEADLWTIPHLILTHNTQDFVQIMLISFVWLYMFKCDVYAQFLVDQTQKDFWVFYKFLKVILILLCLYFLFKMQFCVFFFFKNWFRGIFAINLRLRASCKIFLREIKKSHFHTETLATASRVLRD